MELSGFETLFSKNVPHILEKIFLFLDYKSYKVCLDVSVVWRNLLMTKTFQMKAKSVYRKEILSVPERSEGTEVSKMAIREGTVFWGVWGGFPPL